jgi:hypothetical protein
LAPKVSSVNLLTFDNQVDIKDEETYSIYLEDAFPRAMSLVDLSSGAVNQAGRLNMTFTYRRWFAEHPSFRGRGSKTNFDPKLKPPFVNNLINPSPVIDSVIVGRGGNGTSNIPFRMDINGTNSSSTQ